MGTLKRCNTLLRLAFPISVKVKSVQIKFIKMTDDQLRDDMLLETCLKITVFGNKFIYFVIF